MRRTLWCVAAVALAVLPAGPAGASAVNTRYGSVRPYDDACGPDGYQAGDDSPYPAYEHCDDEDHFYDGNGCCYEG